jgi:hypothetical protein
MSRVFEVAQPRTGEGGSMMTFMASPTAGTSCLADDLWKELKDLADDGLARRAETTGTVTDNRIRGEVYLFIVDMIAQQIDRLDQEAVSTGAPAARASSG